MSKDQLESILIKVSKLLLKSSLHGNSIKMRSLILQQHSNSKFPHICVKSRTPSHMLKPLIWYKFSSFLQCFIVQKKSQIWCTVKWSLLFSLLFSSKRLCKISSPKRRTHIKSNFNEFIKIYSQKIQHQPWKTLFMAPFERMGKEAQKDSITSLECISSTQKYKSTTEIYLNVYFNSSVQERFTRSQDGTK